MPLSRRCAPRQSPLQPLIAGVGVGNSSGAGGIGAGGGDHKIAIIHE